jgi:AICAR transformylase/IMP cyclohydrolase PurH
MDVRIISTEHIYHKELNPTEADQIWNIAKRELLALKYYPSFEDFKQKISEYFRTKRFGLNMRNYLLRTVKEHI